MLSNIVQQWEQRCKETCSGSGFSSLRFGGLCWLRIAPHGSKSPCVHTLLRAGADTDPLQLSRLTHLATPEPALLNSFLTSLCPWHGEPTKQVAAQGGKMMAGGFLLSCALFLLISIVSFMVPLFIYFIYSTVMPSLQMLQCRYGFENYSF